MSNTDKRASATTASTRNKALASFYAFNPTANEGGRNRVMFSAVFHAGRVAGQIAPDCCAATEAPAPCDPGTITNFLAGSESGGFIFPNGGSGTELDPFYFNASWDPLAIATSYTVTSTLQDGTLPTPPDLIEYTGPTSAKITTYYSVFGGVTRTFKVTAQTTCGPTTTSLDINPCFLAGSLVQMADGTAKAIEDVRVGEWVVGAFGEVNAVLALHRPLLGAALMCKINDEHSTTNHHPHISVDRQFYCGNPELVSSTTYGRVHKVIDASGAVVDRLLHGLKKERIRRLTVGVELKTVEGSRTTRTLETYAMPADTQLYNLVIGGSHTYHVDGYAVTGWPREDDFDYDAWAAKN